MLSSESSSPSYGRRPSVPSALRNPAEIANGAFRERGEKKVVKSLGLPIQELLKVARRNQESSSQRLPPSASTTPLTPRIETALGFVALLRVRIGLGDRMA